MKNKLSKIISVALSLVLVCLMCITASASQLSGDGTKNSPYIISTADQLDTFAQMVAGGDDFSGKFVVIDADIAVNAGFAPIGSEAAPFKGVCEGNSITVSGIDVIQDNYAGLFGYTDGAVISGITVSGSFQSIDFAGAIAAYAKDTVIENCNVSALVCSDTYTGGVAGYLESGKIVSCTTTNISTIGNFAEYCGGIAGFASGDIADCTNNAYTYGTKNVGGIAGYSTGDIASCTNTVTVNATKTNLGGIAGLTEGTVEYCKNTGKIFAIDMNAGKIGGIAGVAYNAVITECMNNGEVTATGSFAGGIAGYATKTEITNCIATENTTANGEYAGGIFGFALEGKAEKCVATAAVTAKNSTAGGIGAIAQCTVADCYYNNEKATKAVLSGTATNTAGVSSADLTDESALTALDFTTTWAINSRHADYPLLESIPYHSIEISVSTEATCTEDGQLKGICTICADELDETTPAFGHSFMKGSSQDATCTQNGYKDFLCSICGATETETLPATGHSDANTDGICDACGKDISEKQPEAEKTIFEKIADFFKSIIEWIKGLFS